MKRVLFLTNYPAPYRVSFFDELGKSADVTVLYSVRTEDMTHRDPDWFISGEGRFRSVQLKPWISRGKDPLCLDVLHWLRKDYDAIVICGYSEPTVMLAMAWLRLRRIPFYIELYGGLIRPDSKLKYRFKRLLVSGADSWLSSGDETSRYLTHYGAKPEKIYTYPFSSLWEKDILPRPPGREEKLALRRELGMREEKILLYVGRFSKPKGMDDLLEAASELEENVGVYFIGGQPEQTHLDFCREHKLDHVHFVGFQKRDQLRRYYLAADALALPTWSDVWGLVINEAMACALPVITTDRCVAGLELIENGINGYVVPVRDIKALAEKINLLLSGDYSGMGAAALETIRPYTIENMARRHVEIFAQEG